jgi:hypothetical protein
MPTAAAAEISLTGQPNAWCSGVISTPGAARRPAAASSDTNVAATTTQA